jgi:hypothetical protein
MQRYIALFLAILFLLQPVSKVLYVVDYSLNKAYIISTYCINREKPQLACEGKCHLTKQLTKAGQAEKAHLVKEKIKILYFMGSVLSFLASPAKTGSSVHTLYLLSYSFGVAQRIFHPPQAAYSYRLI